MSPQETFFHATADYRNKCVYTNTYMPVITISKFRGEQVRAYEFEEKKG